MWLVDDAVRLLELEYPKLVGGVAGLKAALGEPDATLEFAWDVLKVKGGELVWASKGITLFIDPENRENQAAIRITVYATTDMDTYSKRIRLDRTTYEWPIDQ